MIFRLLFCCPLSDPQHPCDPNGNFYSSLEPSYYRLGCAVESENDSKNFSPEIFCMESSKK